MNIQKQAQIRFNISGVARHAGSEGGSKGYLDAENWEVQVKRAVLSLYFITLFQFSNFYPSKYLKMSHKEPEIVKFAFTQFEINEKQPKWHAVCYWCKASISETLGTTSSFSR